MAVEKNSPLLRFGALTNAQTLVKGAVSASLENPNLVVSSKACLGAGASILSQSPKSKSQNPAHFTVPEVPGTAGAPELKMRVEREMQATCDQQIKCEHQLQKRQNNFKRNLTVSRQRSASSSCLTAMRDVNFNSDFDMIDRDNEQDVPMLERGFASTRTTPKKRQPSVELNLDLISAIEEAAEQGMDLDWIENFPKQQVNLMDSDGRQKVDRFDGIYHAVTDEMLRDFAYAGTDASDNKFSDETQRILELSILTAQKEQIARRAKEQIAAQELRRVIEDSMLGFEQDEKQQQRARDDMKQQALDAIQQSFKTLDASKPGAEENAGTDHVPPHRATARAAEPLIFSPDTSFTRPLANLTNQSFGKEKDAAGGTGSRFYSLR